MGEARREGGGSEEGGRERERKREKTGERMNETEKIKTSRDHFPRMIILSDYA